MKTDLHIGTSGYSYPDWKGCYYPANLKPGEMLEFYAQEFDAVEINYTFYRIPTAASLDALARKVPPDFKFTLKLHQSFTHDRQGQSRGDHSLNADSLQTFVAALHPLQVNSQLGAILAQFPSSFSQSSDRRRYLEQLRHHLGDLPVVVEFRHCSWSNPEVWTWLTEVGLGFCCVDQPALPGLMPATAIATSPIAYVRLHGRNGAKWWQHNHAYERYDYSYTPAELAEWLPRLQQLKQQAQQVYIFTNNCYKSQAIDAARQLKTLLHLDTSPRRPQQLQLF